MKIFIFYVIPMLVCFLDVYISVYKHRSGKWYMNTTDIRFCLILSFLPLINLMYGTFVIIWMSGAGFMFATDVMLGKYYKRAFVEHFLK